MTKWCFPCPECDFVEHNSSGFPIAPLWNEKGSTCPNCKVECRVRKVGQAATEHAEIEAVS